MSDHLDLLNITIEKYRMIKKNEHGVGVRKTIFDLDLWILWDGTFNHLYSVRRISTSLKAELSGQIAAQFSDTSCGLGIRGGSIIHLDDPGKLIETNWTCDWHLYDYHKSVSRHGFLQEIYERVRLEDLSRCK